MITIVIAVGSIVVILFSGLKQQWNHFRVKAVFVLICFVVGPGLLVNALFKDNWGRPRPAQILDLGGEEAYVPPLLYNANGDGKSFPSGHSSVGFALIGFYFVLRKRHLFWARIAFLSALLIGTGLGVARMAAGGHFLSDVFWSMFITVLVPLGLFPIFKEKLNAPPSLVKTSTFSNIVFSSIAFLFLALGVFNWPVKQDEKKNIDISQYDKIIINVEQLSIKTKFSEEINNLIVRQRIRGFGLPMSKVILKRIENKESNSLELVIEKKGMLQEVEGSLTITIPESQKDKFSNVLIK